MAEYQSFHYLMHKPAAPVKAFYTSGPTPLSFNDLYSPRQSRILINQIEKSYWRTRDRIEYAFWEDRQAKVMIITCRCVQSNTALRTIFVDLEVLYFEVMAKASHMARGDTL